MWKAGVIMDNVTIIVNSFDYKAIAAKALLIHKLPAIICYEHPLDFPDKFVARLFYLGASITATKVVITGDTYDELLKKIYPVIYHLGLNKLLRSADDDKCVIETWL